MLQKIEFLPGFNKQVTPTGAEGEWTAGDYVRFRYGTPEKIGGWSQLGENFLTGAARAQHQFINSSGFKYSAIGTNRILYIYTGGVFYDIHPIKSTTTLTSAFTTTNASTTVTISFSASAKKHSYLGLSPKPSLINSSSVIFTESGSFSKTANSIKSLNISETSSFIAFLIL